MSCAVFLIGQARILDRGKMIKMYLKKTQGEIYIVPLAKFYYCFYKDGKLVVSLHLALFMKQVGFVHEFQANELCKKIYAEIKDKEKKI